MKKMSVSGVLLASILAPWQRKKKQKSPRSRPAVHVSGDTCCINCRAWNSTWNLIRCQRKTASDHASTRLLRTAPSLETSTNAFLHSATSVARAVATRCTRSRFASLLFRGDSQPRERKTSSCDEWVLSSTMLLIAPRPATTEAEGRTFRLQHAATATILLIDVASLQDGAREQPSSISTLFGRHVCSFRLKSKNVKAEGGLWAHVSLHRRHSC
jgi:hypothetical protein